MINKDWDPCGSSCFLQSEESDVEALSDNDFKDSSFRQPRAQPPRKQFKQTHTSKVKPVDFAHLLLSHY